MSGLDPGILSLHPGASMVGLPALRRSRTSDFAALVALESLLFILDGIAAARLFGHTKPVELLAAAIYFGPALFSAVILKGREHVAVPLHGLLLALAVGALAMPAWVGAAVACVHILSLPWLVGLPADRSDPARLSSLAALLVSGTTVVVLAADATIRPGLWALMTSAGGWVGALLGAMLLATALRCSAPPRALWSTLLPIVVVPVALVDTTLSHDAFHYSAYVGPAYAVLTGGKPLVDVFCQYGLAYLPFAAAFSLFGVSYAVAAATASLLTVAQYAAIVLVLRRLIADTWVYWLTALLVPVFFHHLFPYNTNTTPSVIGARFLPAALMLAAVVWAQPYRRWRPAVWLAFALAAAWSLESLLFATIVLTVSNIVADPASGWVAVGRGLVKSLTAAGLCVAVNVAALTAVVGQMPDLSGYVGMLASYTSATSSTAGKAFMRTIENGLFLWIPAGMLYFTVLSRALVAVFSGEQELRQALHGHAATAALGVATSSYFFGNSLGSVLLAASFPALVLLASALDRGQGAVGAHVSSFRSSAVILLVLASGASAYRLSQAPILERQEPVRGYPVSLLSGAIKGETGLAAAVERLRHPGPTDAGADVIPAITATGFYGERARLREAISLIERKIATDGPVLVLMPEATPALALTGRKQSLPISNAGNDQLSPHVTRLILQQAMRLPDHAVVLSAAWPDLQPFERQILRQLSETRDLEQLDGTPLVRVYRLSPKGAVPSERLAALPMPISHASSSIADAGPYKAVNLLDGDATTLIAHVTNKPEPYTLDFILPQPMPVGHVEFVPNPGNAELLPDPVEVDVSLDGVTWRRAFSGNLREAGRFYSVTFSPQPARTVRISGSTRMYRGTAPYFVQIADVNLSQRP